MKLTKKLSLLAVIAAASVAGQAQAGFVSYSTSFNWTLTDLTGASGSNPVTLNLPQYNGPGTLTGVTISFQGDWTTGGSPTSPPSAPTAGSSGYTTPGTVTNTASTTSSTTISIRAQDFSANPLSGSPAALTGVAIFTPFQLIKQQSYTLAPGASANWDPFTFNGTQVQNTYSGSQLAGFAGSGTFGWGINSSTLQSYNGGGGNFASAINTAAQANATVIYTFGNAAVPVPATLALLGLGLGIMGMRKRKA